MRQSDSEAMEIVDRLATAFGDLDDEAFRVALRLLPPLLIRKLFDWVAEGEDAAAL